MKPPVEIQRQKHEAKKLLAERKYYLVREKNGEKDTASPANLRKGKNLKE